MPRASRKCTFCHITFEHMAIYLRFCQPKAFGVGRMYTWAGRLARTSPLSRGSTARALRRRPIPRLLNTLGSIFGDLLPKMRYGCGQVSVPAAIAVKAAGIRDLRNGRDLADCRLEVRERRSSGGIASPANVVPRSPHISVRETRRLPRSHARSSCAIRYRVQ